MRSWARKIRHVWARFKGRHFQHTFTGRTAKQWGKEGSYFVLSVNLKPWGFYFFWFGFRLHSFKLNGDPSLPRQWGLDFPWDTRPSLESVAISRDVCYIPITGEFAHSMIDLDTEESRVFKAKIWRLDPKGREAVYGTFGSHLTQFELVVAEDEDDPTNVKFWEQPPLQGSAFGVRARDV